jgi:fructose-1,6-bisphosphatase/inositol monophosphatase family enzyme
MAAGLLLVREAGGLVSALGQDPGGGNPLATGSVLAAAPDLHKPLTDTLLGS